MRSRLIKALNNRFYVKFMELEIGLLESLTIEIRLPFTKPIILMTLYRPEGPVKVYNNILNLISNILFEDKEFIMMGDVNANVNSKSLDNDAKHMKNIYDSNNLTQLITEPTRTTDNTQTLIDHAVTNRPSQILDSGVIPCGISDRDIIYVLRNSRLAKIKKEPRVVNVRNFKRFSASDFVRELEGLPFDLIKI